MSALGRQPEVSGWEAGVPEVECEVKPRRPGGTKGGRAAAEGGVPTGAARPPDLPAQEAVSTHPQGEKLR